MNHSVLNKEVQDYINSNLNLDISDLMLRGKTFDGVSTLEIAQQIETKRKSKSKLPTWFSSETIYYPPKLHIEQTSSEQTASYKADTLSGNRIIDLTGGFGVDCFYFSKKFREVVHCEVNPQLSKIATFNFGQFKTSNIKTVAEDGIAYLNRCNQNFDWVYIDPSRRHDKKGKVFFLKDCLPNVPEHLESIFRFTQNIAIKTSPLLDLSVGIKELKSVKQIHVIAVNNEVKELLWILNQSTNQQIKIVAVNIKKDNSKQFSFNFTEEEKSEVIYSEPLDYLYEPNSALLKAGAFKILSEKFNLFKLHRHSHLYTSKEKIEFPGRIFKIENILNYNKKEFQKTSITKANITTRNFPESVQSIRKKLNIKEGGDIFLFFTTNLKNQKIALKCSKMN